MRNFTTKTSISDFDFKPSGYGHYKVTYTSPKTNKSWSATISHMPLIDATKNSEQPTQKNLNYLKSICKNV